jgi:kynurenine 3-monooxygenase
MAADDHLKPVLLEPVTIVGGGPAGALAALMLSRRGYCIRLFEGRDDPRLEAAAEAEAAAAASGQEASLAKSSSASKRSINLALSHRGLCAMRRVDPSLAERMLAEAVPMRGRIIHGKEGGQTLQPYGTESDEVLYSIGRQRINVFLLEELRAAEALPTGSPGAVTATFGAKLKHASADGSTQFDTRAGPMNVGPGRVLGCDGAFSATRKAMGRMSRLSVSLEYIDHGYKEMCMPADTKGGHRMPPEGLHIWPGSEVMLIALPNTDGSFTCTIFGDFAVLDSLQTSEQARPKNYKPLRLQPKLSSRVGLAAGD